MHPVCKGTMLCLKHWVKTNQTITKGDILATVDMASVISAMADLQTKNHSNWLANKPE